MTGRTSGSLKTCASYPQSCCYGISGRRKQRDGLTQVHLENGSYNSDGPTTSVVITRNKTNKPTTAMVVVCLLVLFLVITFCVRRSQGELVMAVSLSLAAFPHYWTDLGVTWGMLGVPSSCALLGGFAKISAWVLLL